MATQFGKKVPLGAIFFTSLGAALLVRGFWNPHRAVVKDGFATSCEGERCSPYTALEASEGAGPVYSVARGLVVRASAKTVFVIPNREAVVLEYRDLDQIMVREGQTIGAGQQIASSAKVLFAVFRIDRRDDGTVAYVPLSPSAWLAARGAALSAKKHAATAEGTNWCEGGRHLTMPEKVGQCNIKLPEPASVALLPISVTMG